MRGQATRFSAVASESRIDDPRKTWKLSELDLRSFSRWNDYSQARDGMFAATDTEWAPWYLAHTDDKRRARLNVLSHLLSQIPYEPLVPSAVALPDRHVDAAEPRGPRHWIPTPF